MAHVIGSPHSIRMEPHVIESPHSIRIEPLDSEQSELAFGPGIGVIGGTYQADER
jgi:hypothetical protein